MLTKAQLQTAVWVYDIDNLRIVWANAAALLWWQSDSYEELYSRDFSAVTSAAVKQSLQDYKTRFEAGESACELWQFSPGGIIKQAFCQFSGITLPSNKTGMLVEATPVDLLDKVVNGNSISILATFSENGDFKSCNPPFEKEFGFEKPQLSNLLSDSVALGTLFVKIKQQQRWETDLLLKTQAGAIWFHTIVTNSIDDMGEHTILLHFYNIDHRKKRELDLVRQAQTDALTGLLNRRGLNQQLAQLLHQTQSFSVFYIDLDGFKMINDSFGHTAGDGVLRDVSDRLKNVTAHPHLSCRAGGDEFVLAVKECLSSKQLEAIATLLVDTLSAPYSDENSNMMILSASVGLSVFPKDAQSVEDIIRFADAAMYQSKKRGKRRWTRYQSNMEKHILRKSLLAQYASKALDNQELSLNFQPIIDTKTNTVAYFEALLRWYNPVLGHVSPQELISIAEDIGLIKCIEQWVINNALAALPDLRSCIQQKVPMAINVSGLHITDESLPDTLSQALKKNHLEPSDLIVEITESVLIDGLEQPNHPLKVLTDQGIKLSIDDFGKGYSSLSYLHLIEASTVKIDKAFLNDSKKGSLTLKAVHQLINSLGKRSLIEGIETKEQALQAAQIGITQHQGYFYCRPQPLSFFTEKASRLNCF